MTQGASNSLGPETAKVTHARGEGRETVAKRKLTVNISEELVDVLQDLAKRNDSNMTEELKKAIRDRKYFTDKIDEGREVHLVGKGQPDLAVDISR